MGSRSLPFGKKIKWKSSSNDDQFGIFVFHHTQHNVGLMCRKK